MVEKSPPRVMPRHRMIRGRPTIPAYCIADAYGAAAVYRSGMCSDGVSAQRNHWNSRLTARTQNGEISSALGRVICGNLTSEPIPTMVSNPKKHQSTSSTACANAFTSWGIPTPATSVVTLEKSALASTVANHTREQAQKKNMKKFCVLPFISIPL